MMKIALLGMGTIGAGVYEILAGRDDIAVARVLERRALPEIAALRTENYEDILNDPEIDTVVELLGGVEPAHSFACRALLAGKNVVSANKLMIGHDLRALLDAARAGGAQLRISASVGGGIPVLPNLIRARRADELQSVGGIVNGTTNLILDTMQRDDRDFAEALAAAQAAGYAEADPSADIDGIDALSKLAIAGSIAFDVLLDAESIDTAGIRSLRGADVANFRRLGRVCRLIARAARTAGGVSAYVEPMLLAPDALEAGIHQNDNCISYVGARAGRQALIGQGAGQQPTACAVVGDLLDILTGAPVPDYVPVGKPAVAENSRAAHRYYVRTCAELPFAAEAVGENAWVTEPVSVAEMHAAMRKAREEDVDAFFAGIWDEG